MTQRITDDAPTAPILPRAGARTEPDPVLLARAEAMLLAKTKKMAMTRTPWPA